MNGAENTAGKTKRAGGRVDLLHGSIFRSLILFALPILGSNIFQQLYNTMDTVIVGHTLGESSLAAVGACSSIYDMLIGFALGIGNGLSLVTARSYGSGDRRLLKRSVAASVVIGIILTVLMMILTRFILRPLLILLNTPADILEESYGYISLITLFIGVMFAYNLCAGLLRAIGNSLMPLVFLIISSILNIALDLFLIVYLDMGVRGAAVATVISQGISVLLCIFYMITKVKILIPSREDFRPQRHLYRELTAQGLAMGFMNCLIHAGSVLLQSSINSLGYLTIAGHTAARRIYSFGMMPLAAMSNAINTFVSQNRGADQGVRIRKGLKTAMLYDLAVSAVIFLLMLFLAPSFVHLISGSDEPVILQNGASYVRVAAFFYPVLGMVNCYRLGLQGLGQKLRPILSSITELIAKYLFAVLLVPRFGYTAIVFCEPAIWCIMAAELVTAFYRDPYIRAAKQPSNMER